MCQFRIFPRVSYAMPKRALSEVAASPKRVPPLVPERKDVDVRIDMDDISDRQPCTARLWRNNISDNCPRAFLRVMIYQDGESGTTPLFRVLVVPVLAIADCKQEKPWKETICGLCTDVCAENSPITLQCGIAKLSLHVFFAQDDDHSSDFVLLSVNVPADMGSAWMYWTTQPGDIEDVSPPSHPMDFVPRTKPRVRDGMRMVERIVEKLGDEGADALRELFLRTFEVKGRRPVSQEHLDLLNETWFSWM